MKRRTCLVVSYLTFFLTSLMLTWHYLKLFIWENELVWKGQPIAGISHFCAYFSHSKIQQASRAMTGSNICIIESPRQKWNLEGYSLFRNGGYLEIFQRKLSIFYLIAKININLYFTFSTFVTWVESGLLKIWKDYGGSHVSVDNSINRGSFSVYHSNYSINKQLNDFVFERAFSHLWN